MKIRFNEKTIILLIFMTSVISFLTVFNNLPSYDYLVVTPKNKNRNIHIKMKDHELYHLQQVPPAFIAERNEISRISKEKIKIMFLHAWNGYKKFAWGKNELNSLSENSYSPSFLGYNAPNLGLSIIDGLDTLYLMGFTDEFNFAKEWIINKFDFNIDSNLAAFEVNNRLIGGLLSLYTFTNEKVFLDKAEQVAQALFPIFDTKTALPYDEINPYQKKARNKNGSKIDCASLEEIGSFSLEFYYLSKITNNNTYEEKINQIFQALERLKIKETDYFSIINVNTGDICNKAIPYGTLAKNHYEYLLKLYLLSNKADRRSLDLYLKSINAINNNLVKNSADNLKYINEFEIKANLLVSKMRQSTCSVAGLLALTSSSLDLDDNQKQFFISLAEDIANTCHELSIKTISKLGSNSFYFGTLISNEVSFKLTSEIAESYFYLWRVTKDSKYREWATDFTDAIEKHCRTNTGYSGIIDVNQDNPKKDGIQPSYFLSETLKYLYLIFSEDDVVSLDRYVFNKRGHPFLVNKKRLFDFLPI